MDSLEALQTGQLAGRRQLKLACGLTEFPSDILHLADSLEILDLTHNRLRSLPDEFARLQNLKIVFLSQNDFEVFPEVLGQCPNLEMIGLKSNRIHGLSEQALPPSVRWLILTDNRLEQLPTAIAGCPRLQKLMLAGNRLRSLPEAMVACQNLELIRISANQLDALPEWLVSLPRLAWLAYAGNPFCHQPAIAPTVPIPQISWSTLSMGEPLGEGASGVTSKATWQTETDPVTVAVKLFKGGITSDGFPSDEMQAGMSAGAHPHLVKVVGQVSDHPANGAGLVFEFIPSDYQILGNPPDFETCTRDTYPVTKTFTLPLIRAVASGMAAAAAHLHSRGIMHGDLYAHNILVNPSGAALLGDFGAASLYDPADVMLGRALERLEVRAFGCLLEDLLDRCQVTAAEQRAIAHLRTVQHACLAPIPANRPLFADLCPLL